MTKLLLLGLSHKTAPLELRERLAMSAGQAADIVESLAAGRHVSEAVVVSTCNRTELYLVVGDHVEAESAALGLLAKRSHVSPTRLSESLYSRRDIDAVRHLFRVAAGLESMILGETEILSQVKRSYELALAEGTTGMVANRLFREAIAAGKRARHETAFAEGRISMSSAAVDLADRLIGNLSERRVLVIGAGDTGELTAKALADRGVHTVFVANRRYDRAIGLADRFGGKAIRFDDLPAELEQADIVVSSTASPHALVDHEEMALIMTARRSRPLLIVDIAVPRDFDPAVRNLDSVHLYDIDDLHKTIEQTMSHRRSEALRAAAVVEDQIDRFARWLDSLEVVPTIAELRERARSIVEQTLADNERKWRTLDAADRAHVETVVNSVVAKLLHEPTVRLREAAGAGEGLQLAEAVRELFDLDASRSDVEYPDQRSDRAAEHVKSA